MKKRDKNMPPASSPYKFEREYSGHGIFLCHFLNLCIHSTHSRQLNKNDKLLTGGRDF